MHQQYYNLQNKYLKIKVNQTGAELCEILRLSDKKNFMWDANPEIWEGYSPVLFPIIGALKEDFYIFKGNRHSIPRHGFVRNNTAIRLFESTPDSLTFQLMSSPETLKQYPFDFEFFITYKLKDNTIIVEHLVENTGNSDMFFSLGAHPAFKCPLNPDEKYTDYFLEFEHTETAHTYKIEPTGLIGEKSDLILNNSKTINLNYHLFDKGALVFKSLKSRCVSLVSKNSGRWIEVKFDGFPILGIWAKPNADYVCIEPWLGIADSYDTNQDFETKEGIIKLEANGNFKASYSITTY